MEQLTVLGIAPGLSGDEILARILGRQGDCDVSFQDRPLLPWVKSRDGPGMRQRVGWCATASEDDLFAYFGGGIYSHNTIGGSVHTSGSDVGYGNMTITGTGSGSGWAGGYSNYSNEGTTCESNWTSSSGYSYSGWSSSWDNSTDTNGYGYQDGWDETYSYGWGSGSQWGSGGTASGSNTDDSGSSWGWTMYSGGAWYSGSGSDSTSSSGSYSESISSPGSYGGGLNWSPFATGGQGLGYGMSAPGVTVEPDAEGSGNLWSRGGADMGEEIGTMSDALMEAGGSSSPSGSSPGAEGNEGSPGEAGQPGWPGARPSDWPDVSGEEELNERETGVYPSPSRSDKSGERSGKGVV